jgi:paraquat-inducible protein B
LSEQLKESLGSDIPESVIQPRAKFSIVWLVPLIALLIGAWLAYKAWSEMGPIITITFKTADGLEAGKTKIKYKNVQVGEVKTISIDHKSGNVLVTAELDKELKPYLTDKTNFWVVRARVAVSGVSGLETLFSGAYISYEPNTEGKKTRGFTGLEIPPVITRDIPGKHFLLHADNLGSLERDVPVYYRRFNVGTVEDVKLDDDGKSVSVRIFIREPYAQWVNHTTKFWNASGIDLSLSASGIEIDSDSLVSVLIGGIAFASASTDENIEPAIDGTEFKLYPSRKDSLKKKFMGGISYVLNFPDSVRGLTVGAPVEFKGIQMGEVTAIGLSYNPENKKISIPVTVLFEVGRMAFQGNKESVADLMAQHIERTNYFIQQGLRAQLKTGNLLTGQLYIDLDFFKDAPPYKIDWNAKIPEFPTIPGTLGEMAQDVNSILKKVDSMMTQVQQLSYKLNHTLAPELTETLNQTQTTLVGIQATLKNDSPLQQDLQFTLKELAKAARSIKSLADYLERHPESLIRGKKGQ